MRRFVNMAKSGRMVAQRKVTPTRPKPAAVAGSARKHRGPVVPAGPRRTPGR